MRKLAIILLLGFSTYVHAQLASYNFNSGGLDQIGSYHPSEVFGVPDYSSGEYVALDSGEYIVLPDALNAAFDNTESLEIHFRFMVEGDWEATPALDGFGEEARIILTTKEEYDARVGGFDVAAREWESQLWLMVTYGDGIDYDFGWSKGKGDFVSQIEPGNWYDVTIKFVFEDELPYIQYIVNGTVSLAYYPDREEDEFAMDYEGFRQTITQQQIVIGSTLNNTIAERDGEHPSLDLLIDSLAFSSPASAGNPIIVEDVLVDLIDHMNGVSMLSDQELEALQGLFVTNWDDATFDIARSTVLTYMETYEQERGFIFNLQFNGEGPDSFDPLKAIQFQMQQWILDNKYSSQFVNDMASISFLEHERFPGAVNSSAVRLEDATFAVDGDYMTDPGFYLNNQEYVRRPTGFFAPAGELVTLEVPAALTDKGLTVYVGAHRKNLQETFNEFRRFPRVSTTFELNAETITIANPFGGGIYIAIPDGNQLGPITFGISGAVKAPYYCRKEGFETSLTEFMAEIAKEEVPYVDMESENFMTTISNGMARGMQDPDSILNIWDRSFDAINIALGRPLKRFRSEYIIHDRQSHVKYTGAPAAYPMSLEIYAYPYEEVYQQPVDVESGRSWYNGSLREVFNYVLFHEYGHLHNMPTLYFEQETNVHLPATAAYSMVMGESIDSAFVYSMAQRLNLEQATFDWIFTSNFINGARIGPEPDNPWDQLLYQSRGMVKLVDIAKMFGWEALGDINAYFYTYQLDNPDWSPYDLQDDKLIEVASNVMGFNMAPHFEFHGILPSEELVANLSSLPTSETIKERILHYRFRVPKNNEEFTEIYDQVINKIDPTFHVPRWNDWKSQYDESYAASIIARIDSILEKYYDLSTEDMNDEPRILGLVGPLSLNEDESIEISLTDFVVEDLDHEFPDEMILNVGEGENYELDGEQITPAENFSGDLAVPVTVSDGIETSDEYVVIISVIEVNDLPVIARQLQDFVTDEDVAINLSLSDFEVNDPDHDFPGSHTLLIADGENYTVNNAIVSPAPNYNGSLSVPVSVSDGVGTSEAFIINLTVNSVNDIPVITESSIPPGIRENSTLDIMISDFSVTDPDHTFPEEHTLAVANGANYTWDGTTLVPVEDFIGMLSIPITISDGVDESEVFEVELAVSKILGSSNGIPDLVVYPNPTKDGLIHITGLGAEMTFKITDLTGRELQSGTVSKLTPHIQIEGKNGVFILLIETSDGERSRTMLLRQE